MKYVKISLIALISLSACSNSKSKEQEGESDSEEELCENFLKQDPGENPQEILQ